MPSAQTNAYRKMSSSSLRVGLVVPGDLRDSNDPDIILIGSGVRITRAHLTRLQERSIKNLLISHADWHILQRSLRQLRKPAIHTEEAGNRNQKILTPARWGKAPFDPKRVNTFRQDRQKHASMFEQMLADQTAPIRGEMIQSVTSESISSMNEDLDLFVKTSLESVDLSDLHQHCLSVGRIAISVATVMKHPLSQVEHIGTGCFLSRFGILPGVMNLINSPNQLNASEILEIRKAPLQTLNHIEKGANIPHAALLVAFQIYERYDGSGYPRGRIGAQIHPLARIASVCDAFVALTSHRPHRRAYDSYEALEVILAETKLGRFDPNVVRGLLQTVSLYPIGSYVMLNDGRLGQVLRNNPTSYDRPIIRIAGGHSQMQLVDLESEPHLQVVKCRSGVKTPLKPTPETGSPIYTGEQLKPLIS